jgi:predicted phosphohydrolase
MNFHLISDIHLEFRYYSLKSHINKYNRFGIPENEEINLILAGDVGYPEQRVFNDFIKSVIKLYDNVFMVIGNHEYYKKDIDSTKNLLNDIKYPNFYLLDNTSLFHNNIYIIGSTLWTYLEENDQGRKYPINDYKFIKDMTIEKTNEMFLENKKYLKDMIDKCTEEKKDCIVITHHIPSFDLINPIFKGGEINSFFASNCDGLIKPPVRVWAYGHTHLKANHNINGVELICNPKGYPNEISGYSKKLFFSIRV